MSFVIKTAPLLAALLMGCTSAHTNKLNASHPSEQAAVEQRLKEILDAAEKKDMPRLDSYHFYGPKFTKFSPEANGRLDAGAARMGEHNGIAPLKDLMMRADDLKIDVFGNTAVATFIMTSSFGVGDQSVGKRFYSTLVFVKEGKEWKIVHEHFSPAKSNSP